MRYYKGQVTFVNLMAIVITLIVFFNLLPVLQGFIDKSAFCLNGGVGSGCPTPPLTPNDQTSTIITLMHISPFMVLLGIIITILIYANPRREGG